jgi:hypothetical protein
MPKATSKTAAIIGVSDEVNIAEPLLLRSSQNKSGFLITLITV